MSSLLNCTDCNLHRFRKQVVPGRGPTPADMMLIGEAPGATEDARGRPFVGRSGMMLNRFLQRANVKRNTVYITNIAKCRPPGNRAPRIDERAACSRHLSAEMDKVRPKKILTLGMKATQAFLPHTRRMGDVIGKPMRLPITYFEGDDHINSTFDLWPLYHPAYVVRLHGKIVKVMEQYVEALTV